MTSIECDVAIIGAGTAGMAAERAARQAGAATRLIDDRFAGTTCASVGCMPSKLLIAAANALHGVKHAETFGIRVDGVRVNGKAVMHRVRALRDGFVNSVLKSLDKLPPDVRIRARARFTDAGTLALSDGRTVSAKAFVIATGSRPSVPKELAAVERWILTNESLFELPDLPKSVAVMGAGPLGLELAQALARLGVEVRVFDQSDRLGGVADDEAERALHSALSADLPITLGVSTHASPDGDAVRIEWSGASKGSQRFEKLLVAAGRPPNLKELNLEATRIELDAHGTPVYETTTMQCGTSALFIAGDADHDRPVLHEAAAEGAMAGRNAAAFPEVTRTERFTQLAIMFTEPQVAIVGEVSQPDAPDVVVGHASYADQGRAKIFACNVGVIRLYAESAHGRLTGASLVGPAVEHTAHLIAWAVQQQMTADQLLQMPLYHPTYEESLKPALRAICEAVDAPINGMATPGE